MADLPTAEKPEKMASTPLPAGGIIKSVYYPNRNVEAVVVVDRDSRIEVSTHKPGSGQAAAVYNQMVDPFTDDDGNPLHGDDQ